MQGFYLCLRQVIVRHRNSFMFFCSSVKRTRTFPATTPPCVAAVFDASCPSTKPNLMELQRYCLTSSSSHCACDHSVYLMRSSCYLYLQKAATLIGCQHHRKILIARIQAAALIFISFIHDLRHHSFNL